MLVSRFFSCPTWAYNKLFVKFQKRFKTSFCKSENNKIDGKAGKGHCFVTCAQLSSNTLMVAKQTAQNPDKKWHDYQTTFVKKFRHTTKEVPCACLYNLNQSLEDNRLVLSTLKSFETEFAPAGKTQMPTDVKN